MNKSALLGGSIATLLFLAYGCSDDDPQKRITPTPAEAGAPDAGAGAQSGGTSSGGRSSSGGATAQADAAGSSSGGESAGGTSGAGGEAGAPTTGGVPAAGGEAGAPTTGGAPATGGASGDGGVGASAGVAEAGSGGELAAAGSANTPEDPRCQQIATDATVTSHLRITADNECDVFVNGASAGSTSNWQNAVTLDVSLFVHPGRPNVVAIVGRNTSSQGGNDRGIVGELTIQHNQSTLPVLITDALWRSAKSEQAGWTALDFDDSGWDFATEIANMGAGPWGNVLPDSGAKWIWSAPVPASTSEKPDLESAYVRRVFYFDFDGLPANAPSCNAVHVNDQ